MNKRFEQDSMTNMVLQFPKQNYIGWLQPIVCRIWWLIIEGIKFHKASAGATIELSTVLFTADHLCHRHSHGSTTPLVAPHLATCLYESLNVRANLVKYWQHIGKQQIFTISATCSQRVGRALCCYLFVDCWCIPRFIAGDG